MIHNNRQRLAQPPSHFLCTARPIPLTKSCNYILTKYQLRQRRRNGGDDGELDMLDMQLLLDDFITRNDYRRHTSALCH